MSGKRGDMGRDDINLTPCYTTIQEGLNQVEFFNLGSTYQDGIVQDYLAMIVCVMRTIDREAGKKVIGSANWQLFNAWNEIWNETVKENKDKKKSLLAILFFEAIALDGVVGYDSLKSGIFEAISLARIRWGHSYEDLTSLKSNSNMRPLNQAISFANKYHRESKKIYFLRPQISRKNQIRMGIATVFILITTLIVRKR